MKVLVLAAGYAVRLKEIAQDTPKPLLEINRKKILDRIVGKVLNIKGVDAIYIITNAKFFEKFQAWANGSADKNKIAVINDGTVSNETRLGAIKDIALAIEKKSIDEDLLIVAGDNLFDFNLSDFLKFARTHSDGISVALHDIKDHVLARNFGVVAIDTEDRIVDFEEKPENPKSTLISTGIYYFPKAKIALLKNYVKDANKLDAPGYYIDWHSRNDKAYGFGFKEDWYDIGSVESYKKADREYKEKEKGKNGKA